MQSVVIPQMRRGIVGALTSEQSAKAIMSGINQFNADGGKMDINIVIYGSQNGYKFAEKLSFFSQILIATKLVLLIISR